MVETDNLSVGGDYLGAVELVYRVKGSVVKIGDRVVLVPYLVSV